MENVAREVRKELVVKVKDCSSLLKQGGKVVVEAPKKVPGIQCLRPKNPRKIIISICHHMSSNIIICHLMSSYVLLCQLMLFYVILKDIATPLEDSSALLSDSPAPFQDSSTPLRDNSTPLKDSSQALKDSSTSLEDSLAPLEDSSLRNECSTPLKDKVAFEWAFLMWPRFF